MDITSTKTIERDGAFVDESVNTVAFSRVVALSRPYGICVRFERLEPHGITSLFMNHDDVEALKFVLEQVRRGEEKASMKLRQD